MIELVEGARSIVETCVRVKPGEKVLVIVDDEAFPMEIGRVMMDVANSAGAEAVLAVMKPRKIAGHEPPHAIAIAMRAVDAVIYITNRHGIVHTNARKEATAAGVRMYQMIEVPEGYFMLKITSGDLEQIKDRTEKLALKQV